MKADEVLLSDVHHFVTDWLKVRRYSPSVRDVRDGLGIKSLSTTSDYLDRLHDQGKIFRNRKIARGITLPEDREELLV